MQWEYLFLTCAYPSEPTGIHVVKYINGQEIQEWKKQLWPISEALNYYGNDHWELVAVEWRGEDNAPSDPVFILKRPANPDERDVVSLISKALEQIIERSKQETTNVSSPPPRG
jgi:hypothetical protein